MTHETSLKHTPEKFSFRTFLGELARFFYWPTLFGLAFLIMGAFLKPNQIVQVESVFASPLFSNFVFLAFSVVMLGILIEGTLATSLDGEMLGTKWVSIWVPLQVAIWALLCAPIIEGPQGFISPLVNLALNSLTWFH